MTLFTAIFWFVFVYTQAAEGRETCSSLPQITDGSYYITPDSSECSEIYGYETSCTVRVVCDDGHRLNGTMFVYCEYTGMERGYQWSEIPTCEAKSLCADGRKPGRVKNGVVDVSGGVLAPNNRFTVGTQLETECNQGHRQYGKSVRSCLPNGEWTARKPRCIPVLCDALQNVSIINGWSDAQNRTYYKGDQIKFYCKHGYRTAGKSWRVCSENSNGETEWTDETPTCEVIRCPASIDFENGERFISDPETRTPGTTINFRCHSGYVLSGPEEVVCKSDGRWSGIRVCDRQNTENPGCGNPGIPYSGRKSGTIYDANERVEFTCNNGFTLIGSSERTCVCNGDTCMWEGEQPTCRGPHEFDDPDDVMKRFEQKTSSIANDTNVDIEASGRTIDVNYDGGWNIYFVLDASNSVGEGNFLEGLDFAKALVSKIGVERARYGAVVYATNPITITLSTSNPKAYDTIPLVQKALDEAKRITGPQRNIPGGVGGGTGTRRALDKVLREMIPLTLQRNNAKNAVFLITDGKSNEGGSPIQEADDLKTDHNVAFHCIGVGDEVDKVELTRLASKPHSEHLFLMQTYNDVQSLAYAVTNQKEVFTQCGIGLGPTGENNPQAAGRIIGGNNAPEGAWPWMAGIYKQITDLSDPEHFCGGTLISPDWILTAAHCFDPAGHDGVVLRPQQIKVVLGSINLYDAGQFDPREVLVNVGEIIIHSNYNTSLTPKYDYDIALLHINPEDRVKLSRNVRTICYPDPATENDDLYELGEKEADQPFPYVTGWGTTSQHNAVTAEIMQQLAIPLKGRRTCQQSIIDLDFDVSMVRDFSERMRCAGYSAGDRKENGELFDEISDRLDSCSGDSGGPLVRQRTADDGSVTYYQIGIVSWGYSCARQGQFGYYTDVEQFYAWINEKMAQ